MNEGPIAHNILDFLKNSTTSPMSLSSSATLLNAETHKQDSSSRLLWSIAVLILLLIGLYCLLLPCLGIRESAGYLVSRGHYIGGAY